jgi:hypothetical protein
MITATQREARFFKGTENGLLQITADAEITTSLLTGWAVIQEQTVGEHKVLPLKRQCGYFFTSPPG